MAGNNGKFDALSAKIKEHAAQTSGDAESGTAKAGGGKFSFFGSKPNANAKPTSAASVKPTTSAKPTSATGVKPTTTAAGAAANVKPTTSSTSVKPTTAASVKPTTTSAARPTSATTATHVANAKKSKFTDVPSGAYYADAVEWAVRKGITTGTTETTFTPNNPCHRGHVATFIWRSKGSPAPKSANNPFSDVSDGPFYKAILWAVENGLMEGTSATTFEPTKPCARVEVLTFLLRAEGKPNAKEADAIKWAALKHLLQGMEGSAQNPCTRADIVTFLYRVKG